MERIKREFLFIESVKGVHKFQFILFNMSCYKVVIHLQTNGEMDSLVYEQAKHICQQFSIMEYVIQVENEAEHSLCPYYTQE